MTSCHNPLRGAGAREKASQVTTRNKRLALAALAIKQAAGDLIEAVFLVRAYRTTLPRFGATYKITDDSAIRFAYARYLMPKTDFDYWKAAYDGGDTMVQAGSFASARS